MLDLQALLLDVRKADVYLLESEAHADVIRSVVEQAGYNFFHLNGKAITNETEFLKEAQRVLVFPSYFGHNWDAFDECMADLPSWIPSAQGNAILCDYFEVFAENDPKNLETAYNCLRHAAQTYPTPQPLFVLLRGDRRPLGTIEDEIQETKLG